MASVVDSAAFQAFFKERFYQQEIDLWKQQPGYALIDTNEDFGGSDGKYPLETNASQGIGPDLRGTLSVQTSPDLYAWLLATVTYYATATLDGPTYRRSMGDKNAFMNAAAVVTMAAARQHQLDLGILIYGDGTGTLGQIGAISSPGVLTLTNASDTNRFFRNMALQSCVNYGGPQPVAAVGYVVDISYRLSSPSITVSTTPGGPPATPAGWGPTAGSDATWLSRYNCLNRVISGFGGWIPKTAPTAANGLWFNVPRYQDSKLYGIFYDGSKGNSISSSLINTSAEVGAMGGNPNLVLMNYRSYGAFKDSIQGSVDYETITTEAGVSFESIKFLTDTGKVNVVPDRNCPAKTAFMLETSTWEKASVGPMTGLLRYPDGQNDTYFYVRPDDDAAQFRIGCDANVICKKPSGNAQIALNV